MSDIGSEAEQSGCDESPIMGWDCLPGVTLEKIPVVFFDPEATSQSVWHVGDVTDGRLSTREKEPSVLVHHPVLMSPA